MANTGIHLQLCLANKIYLMLILATIIFQKYPPERKATAEGWLQYLDSMSHDRCIMIKDIQRQRHSNNQEKENNSEMHFMTMYIDTEHSIEYFINLAQNYMDYLPFDYANEQNSL